MTKNEFPAGAVTYNYRSARGAIDRLINVLRQYEAEGLDVSDEYAEVDEAEALLADKQYYEAESLANYTCAQIY